MFIIIYCDYKHIKLQYLNTAGYCVMHISNLSFVSQWWLLFTLINALETVVRPALSSVVYQHRQCILINILCLRCVQMHSKFMLTLSALSVLASRHHHHSHHLRLESSHYWLTWETLNMQNWSFRQLRQSISPFVRDNIFIIPNLTKSEAYAAYELRCQHREAVNCRSVSATLPGVANSELNTTLLPFQPTTPFQPAIGRPS